MRIQRLKDQVRRGAMFCLCMFLAVAAVYSAGFSALNVRAEESSEEIELEFFSRSEVSLEPSDFTMDIFPDESAEVRFKVIGFEVKEADWVVSESYLFDFAIQMLRVDVIDESTVFFTFGLMPGIDHPTEISIWMSAETDEKPEEPNIIPEGYERGDSSIDFTDEIVYKIHLKLPGAHHRVTFDKNCSDDVIDLPSPVVAKYNDSYLISEPDQYPGRAGYVFSGWSSYPDFYMPVFENGQGYALEDNTVMYAFWKKERGGGGWDSSSSDSDSSSSDSDSSSSQSDSVPAKDNVVTCQMAGYPQNYVWNEAAKACQPGTLGERGVFHPSVVSVPDTADR